MKASYNTGETHDGRDSQPQQPATATVATVAAFAGMKANAAVLLEVFSIKATSSEYRSVPLRQINL